MGSATLGFYKNSGESSSNIGTVGREARAFKGLRKGRSIPAE